MKWLSVLLIALAGFSWSFPREASAGTADKVEITAISHTVLPEGKENIIFKLSGSIAPKVFSIKGDKPRIVLDFIGATYGGKSVLPLADSTLATAIRIGLHQPPEQKVRVVVDLKDDVVVRYNVGEYASSDGTLTVELAPGPAKTKETVAKKPAAAGGEPGGKTLPSPEELAARPLNEKPIPPVLHHKEEVRHEPVPEKVKGSEHPRLLDITFDSSSTKGEMVLFHLNDFYPPTVSAMEKGAPQVFCDFMEMELGQKVRKDIAINGKYVQRIRTTKSNKPNKVQVVLELSPNRDYDLQQVFFKSDNLFVLIVNELAPGKTAGK